MDAWIQWVEGNEALLLAMAAVSVVTFVGTLAIVPVLLSRMPADYFVGDDGPPSALGKLPPGVRFLARALKNVLGVVLLAMGFLMLFIPGQGVLTMLLGVALLDFPGKRRLEKNIASKPRVRKSINWMRARSDRPPLRFDDDDDPNVSPA